MGAGGDGLRLSEDLEEDMVSFHSPASRSLGAHYKGASDVHARRLGENGAACLRRADLEGRVRYMLISGRIGPMRYGIPARTDVDTYPALANGPRAILCSISDIMRFRDRVAASQLSCFTLIPRRSASFESSSAIIVNPIAVQSHERLYPATNLCSS